MTLKNSLRVSSHTDIVDTVTIVPSDSLASCLIVSGTKDLRFFLFFRSGTHRVRSKTLRASDTKRGRLNRLS